MTRPTGPDRPSRTSRSGRSAASGSGRSGSGRSGGSGSGRAGAGGSGRSGSGRSGGSGAGRAGGSGRAGGGRSGSTAASRTRARTGAGAPRRPAPRRRPSPLAGLLGGTRAYVLAIGVLVVLLVSMTIGPLEIFGAQADRVDLLTAQRDQLAGEVDALRQRREQLQDPREIEELARREQGLVRPGEVPYVVVTPTPEPAPPVPAPEQDESLLRRLTRSLTELFR